MIPLKLSLKNFLSYGPALQTIDFEPYHLICLNGKNGHGKSALLDAITWAVWGQARKITGSVKPDEQLLRLGQTHMIVSFEFLFNATMYRIRREFSITHAKPYSTIDFAMIDQQSGKVMPLTDKTLKGTQTVIEKTIGLDYESFINSSFLRQGQSNEFSKKSPKDRKEILGTILGLGRYDQLKKQALEKSRVLHTEQERIKNQAAHYQEELQGYRAAVAALPELHRNLAIISSQEHELHEQQGKIIQEKEIFNSENNHYQLIQLQIATATQEIATHKENLTKIFFQWRATQRTVKNIVDAHLLKSKYQQITHTLQEYQRTIQNYLKLKEDLLKVKQQEQSIAHQMQSDFAQRTQKLEEGKNLIKNELFVLKKRYEQETEHNAELIKQQHDLQAQTTSLQEQRLQAEIKLTQYQNITARFDKRKTYYHQWVARAQATKNELDSLQTKKTMYKDSGNPICPLCEQNLSDSRRRFLQDRCSTIEQLYEHRLKRLNGALKVLKQLLVTDHTVLSTIDQHKQSITKFITLQEELAKNKTHLTTQITLNTSTLASIRTEYTLMREKIVVLEKEHQGLEQEYKEQCLTNQEYTRVKAECSQIERRLAETLPDQHRYETLVKEQRAIEHQLTALERSAQERIHQEHRSRTIHELCALIKQKQKALHILENKAQHYSFLAQKSRLLNEQETTIIDTLRALQEKKVLLMQEKAKLEEQERLAQTRQEMLNRYTDDLKRIEQEYDDYQQIAIALGKDGIQALLIEEILPEIEHEANELLGQLTNNQAHIIIEPLKDLKKGGTKETLDIKISDPMGIRPYELFSGGEAFRIDFALRIAISKLLARRAGTSLQTLIIDEGFGSQDEEGIMHIMEALYAIQDHFAKIIIVSHLPVMKEQFPVHFFVDKGPQGSSITVVQH